MVDLSGDWNSYYRYPSTSRGDNFWGQHILHATQQGNKVRFETDSHSVSHRVADLELSTDGKTVSGTWAEDTDPGGYYKGMHFEGTVTLQITEDGKRLSGIWHGAGRDGTMRSDIWEITRVKTPHEPRRKPTQWKGRLWYPSADDSIEESDEHRMTGHWNGDILVLESEPRKGAAYLLVRLLLQDGIARGSWWESSMPEGEFAGAEYSGAGELIVNTETLHMEGMWAGAGYDHQLNKMRIYTGKWTIEPIDETATAGVEKRSDKE